MWYTIAFYIILFLISNHNNRKVLLWSGIIVALYYGLRYDYMPDYMNYYNDFKRFASSSYVYDKQLDHYEYGWYVLNKIFSPFGFFFFVFICSTVFSYGVHMTVKRFGFDGKYLPIVILGFFSSPNTAVLSSAQRQFLVTGIFLIAYAYLIYNKHDSIKRLWSRDFILYYLIIFLCSTFHTSALILLFVPLLVVIPYNSKYLTYIIFIFIALFLYLAPTYLPPLLMDYIVSSGNFVSLENTLEESTSGDLTVLAILIYSVQLLMFALAFRVKSINQEERYVIIIAIVCILLNLTSPFMQEVYRMGMYIQLFVFIALAIVSKKFPAPFNLVAYGVSWVWIIWNALKVFQLTGGKDVYKTIFSTLF